MRIGAFNDLMEYVSDWLEDSEEWCVLDAIHNAHAGRPDGVIVDEDNLGLFRQYRNSRSADAQDLIDDAKNWKEN